MDSQNSSTLQTKKDLLVSFCRAASEHSDGFMDGETLRYAPQFSLFVTSLCSPLGYEKIFRHPTIIRKTSRAGITGKPRIACSPDGDMKQCNLQRLLSDIFTNVMNDHGTLGMA
jgi:hypothetical protein